MRARQFVSGAAVVFAAAFGSSGCKKSAPASAQEDGAAGETSAIAPAASAPVDGGDLDASGASETERLLAGAAPPACSGAGIDLAAAVVDPRCAIRSSEAKTLRAAIERADAGALGLRQEAEASEDGRVVVRIVNGGERSVALPLSWYAKLPAFTAIAEDARHELFELEPPKLDVKEAEPGKPRAHFARIVIAPGASASARVRISTTITKRLAPPCDAGTCAPPKLPPGRYVLHVGELVADVEAGAPARLDWRVP